MTDADAYSEYKEAPTQDLLSKISILAQQQREEEAEVERLEAELKAAKERLRDTAEFKLPELMDEAGMTKFTLTDGTTVDVSERLRASIPAKNIGPALRWLEDHDCGALIKRQITVEYERDQEALAAAARLEESLKGQRGVHYKRKESVHPQTLAANLTQLLERGEDVPLDLFGAYRQRFAKIKRA